ncbi:MAG: DUF3365 domain-containing protein [Proteobacteria bacterium]|nr:DUF3365 domain-containing protein [Pseudomonadota bacterium]
MKLFLKSILSLAVISSASLSYSDELIDVRKIKAKKIALELTELRSQRAAGFIKPDIDITYNLFKSVCGFVKKRSLELAKNEGVIIRHAAIKHRNPDNAATKEESSFQHLFERNPEIKEIWDETERDGRRYKRYIFPIHVEDACLACHGEKEARPDFIKTAYPRDTAYGFKTGNIRGIIEILVPLN